MVGSKSQDTPRRAGKAVIADAESDWVERLAPPGWRPYLRLARADRPIGAWLLLWPCWWSLSLAASATGKPWPDPLLLLLFGLGAFVMRGAGCTYNDIVDRDLDGCVARTAARPIASGAIGLGAAWAFLIAQSLVGLLILLALNRAAIALGIASLVLVAIYPFMKRFTYWPQLFLGLAFNWGALMGWAAVTGTLAQPALLMYAAGIAWTLGYDTIYAHQDKEDDALIGIKSSALKLGDATRPFLWLMYSTTFFLLALAGAGVDLAWPFYVGLAFAGGHLVWQIKTLDISRPEICLRVFRSNRTFGALAFIAFLLGALPLPAP